MQASWIVPKVSCSSGHLLYCFYQCICYLITYLLVRHIFIECCSIHTSLICALAGLSDAHGHLSVGDRRNGQRAASGTAAARPLRAPHEEVPSARLPSRVAVLLCSSLFYLFNESVFRFPLCKYCTFAVCFLKCVSAHRPVIHYSHAVRGWCTPYPLTDAYSVALSQRLLFELHDKRPACYSINTAL